MLTKRVASITTSPILSIIESIHNESSFNLCQCLDRKIGFFEATKASCIGHIQFVCCKIKEIKETAFVIIYFRIFQRLEKNEWKWPKCYLNCAPNATYEAGKRIQVKKTKTKIPAKFVRTQTNTEIWIKVSDSILKCRENYRRILFMPNERCFRPKERGENSVNFPLHIQIFTFTLGCRWIFGFIVSVPFPISIK